MSSPPSVDPDEYRRIRRIFEAALERPPAERSAFIERRCGGDAKLIAAVERMLAAEAARHSLLDAKPQPIEAERAADACSSCGAPMAATHRYCSACGTPATAATAGERFRPGMLFAGRFRIVTMLGRGGMGEVYRADDLELGQDVALKVLTAWSGDSHARARLRSEVRLARQISHPNVCRVYDIGESGGDLFLSMEYVNGEDLAALLRRIGRLPADKGIEIARKLCAGLEAAHAKGVLHRDLKPSNIMIDGAGEVRVMDFGIAAMAAELDAEDVKSGTPEYMAPEQLDGRAVTVQSDLYALGLVLYELFTGKPAFASTGKQRTGRAQATPSIAMPSENVPELDPRIERVIMSCLASDPKHRPASAFAVAAALPGTSPLAAALAAGQTPPPELVAAAGGVGTLSPVIGTACLAWIAIALLAVSWLSQRSTVIGHVPLTRSAEVMADRARTIAVDLGYTEPPGDTAHGYDLDAALLERIRASDASPTRWEVLRSDRLTAIRFWHRQGPSILTPSGTLWVTRIDPPDSMPGMVTIETDPGGRLLRLVAVPPNAASAGAETDAPIAASERRASAETTGQGEPDWGALFRHAGLDASLFTPAAPMRLPPTFADRRAAWQGTLPDERNTPVRIEAAAYAGLPVYFEVVPPWSTGAEASSGPRQMYDINLTLAVATVVLLSIAAFAARRNLVRGRADRAGALRTALVVGVLSLAGTAPFAKGVLDLSPLAGRGGAIYRSVGLAVILWAFYVALEPAVRRLWPEMLVGWTRLLAGRLRDPLVGRDVLVGVAVGVVGPVAFHLYALIPAWIGGAPELRQPASLDLFPFMIGPVSHAPSFVMLVVTQSLYMAFLSAVSLVFLALLLRDRRLAAAAWVILWIVVFPFDLAYGATVFITGIALFVRFGLLALAVSLMPHVLIAGLGLHFAAGTPYAAYSYLVAAVLAALALYGFHTTLAGKSVFGDAVGR